jgi:single-strand selective monofunctional uracil DNA glycosylase
MELIRISRRLCRLVDSLQFGPPVLYVYNPLSYARAPHEEYLRRYGRGRGRVLLVGMNPGPFGMAQTGVPFGDVAHVRDWLRIKGAVGRPSREHPKRTVLGFQCPRSEVSGSRLWGWAKARYVLPQRFFSRFFVANYCPLVFLQASGQNRTPDRLGAAERKPLFAACDAALAATVDALQPESVVGVGQFAAQRAREALHGRGLRVGTILHPSPANPRANRGWAEAIEAQLREHGVVL